MSTREHIDQLLTAFAAKVQEDMASAVPGGFSFAAPLHHLASREEVLRLSGGRQVLSRLQFSGARDGQGALLLSLRDAIRLGGKRSGLADDLLDSAAEGEEYTEDIRTAFDEVAQTLAGVLAAVMSADAGTEVQCHASDQNVFDAAESDSVAVTFLPDAHYYQFSATMLLADKQLGDLLLLLPAQPFGLLDEEQSAAVADAEGWGEPVRAEASPVPEASVSQGSGSALPDPQKQRKLIDRLIEVCREKTSEEVAALMGVQFALSSQRTDVVSKEDMLGLLDGRQIMARLTLRGEVSGEGYLMTAVRDGSHLGGTLIMLPPGELEQAVSEERFDGEVQDAFGEITNIVAGAFTGVFEEMYRKQLGFVREGVEIILPVKIDPDSDETMPNQLYYVAAFGVRLDTKELGSIHVVLPAAVLELQKVAEQQESTTGPAANTGQGKASPAASAAAAGPEKVRQLQPLQGSGPEILIVSEVEAEGQAIAGVLLEHGFATRLLHFRESFQNYLPGEVCGVFLVMREVNEQGFGVAIKLRGASGNAIPLVVCGPAWTRSKVLQAVRYGASDILITPAALEDIAELVARNINADRRKAA